MFQDNQTEYLTLQDIFLSHRVPISTMRYFIKKYQLPTKRAGRKILISRIEIEKFINNKIIMENQNG